ncbi:MAG: hypothetical protein LBJ13_03695 [Puniceicoccales bacterium]|jgi:lipopolysaccharide biosynthesis glycosyltransferase|nr:hypothetical protein [Puniceicoccales bacterium]
MKKKLKCIVFVEFLLAIVLCFSPKAYSAADCSGRVFVLACDNNYGGPTAVAIQSLKESNSSEKRVVVFAYRVDQETVQKLEGLGDKTTSIHVVDLLDARWRTMPTFDGREIDLIDSARAIGEGRWGDAVFQNLQCGGDLYKFMINLRFFLPEIFASGLLPKDLQGIESFVWLDSDLIVHKDVSDLWEIGGSHPGQRMFGANLCQDPSNPNGCQVEYFDGIGGRCLISGGVVLWHIRSIIEDCRLIRQNVFLDTIIHMRTRLGGSLSSLYFDGELFRFDGEELVFTVYSFYTLRSNSPGASICVLPVAYNVSNAALLSPFVSRPNDIWIFHWDSMEKPWKVSDSSRRDMLSFCSSYSEDPGRKIPEERMVKLEEFAPSLFSSNMIEIPSAQFAMLSLFLQQIISWKEIADRTGFYSN